MKDCILELIDTFDMIDYRSCTNNLTSKNSGRDSKPIFLGFSERSHQLLKMVEGCKELKFNYKHLK